MNRTLTVVTGPAETAAARPKKFKEVDFGDLVERARGGSPAAWDELLDHLRPLVRAVAARFRLPKADTEDVIQAVWLALCEKLTDLREPQALPRWLSVVTAHECHRVIRSRKRTRSVNTDWEEFGTFPTWPRNPGSPGGDGPDTRVMREESIRLVRDGLAELSERHQELLHLLVADPPLPYTEIGERLGMPVGSIGPTRARVLKKLRQTEALRTWLDPDLDAVAA